MSAVAVPSSVTKRSLCRLIAQASQGDPKCVEKVVAPFITADERLLWCGITAKLGLIPTYDFAWVTDRRVGDLEITPLTGDLNVEVCHLQHIEVCQLRQPSFPLWMWAVRIGMYVLFPLAVRALYVPVASEIIKFWGRDAVAWIPWWWLHWAVVLGALAAVPLSINPAIRRSYLRLKKSGLWLKLRGTRGTRLGYIVIFADRDKFAALSTICRLINEQKRLLDQDVSRKVRT